VLVETDGQGVLALGDWSRVGTLNNYSGGVRYHSEITLAEDQIGGRIEIDLGRVVATAEVFVNGRSAGVRVAPPWRADLSGLLKSGDNAIEILVYNTLANHYQSIPSRYRGSPESGLIGPVRLLSRDWKTGDAAGVDVLHRKGGVQITRRKGAVSDFDGEIRDAGNLVHPAGLTSAVSGSSAHNGGGSDFSALFNHTAGNGSGGEGTENDGRTFVGMGAGSTLELTFDPVKAPRGVSLSAVRTYAAHGDARASQHYDLYALTDSAPGDFNKIAAVDSVCNGELNEVTVSSIQDDPLAKGVRKLRFVFRNGALGFNVYREITVEGRPGL
jgi:hypothetical protein